MQFHATKGSGDANAGKVLFIDGLAAFAVGRLRE
jgi:hypothetical protein